MKDLLEYLVKEIVKNPQEVTVEEKTEENGLVNLSLIVAPEDMGQVIGKGGRIIRALREVVRILAFKQGKKVNIELVEKRAN